MRRAINGVPHVLKAKNRKGYQRRGGETYVPLSVELKMAERQEEVYRANTFQQWAQARLKTNDQH